MVVGVSERVLTILQKEWSIRSGEVAVVDRKFCAPQELNPVNLVGADI